MRDSVDPTLSERVSRLLRPDFLRTVMARRVAAGFLVVLAAVIALRPDPAGVYAEVAVASHDLKPGVLLTDGDVQLEKRPAATLPDGARGVADIVGATLAGPARRGEVLTDARVLGPRLAGLIAGRDARLVPLHLTDSGVLDVIRVGDVVDVMGAAQGSEPRPHLLASGAVVAMISAAQSTSRIGGPDGDRVVLLALPAPAATALAGATLVQTVTVTIH